MSGMPKMPRGQKYEMRCCVCNSRAIVPGTTQISSAADEMGDPNAAGSCTITEFMCFKEGCDGVSWLVVLNVEDGTYLQWRKKPNEHSRSAKTFAGDAKVGA